MEQVRENKMGVMPIGKLLISMSLPMMISMLVQALYNIVDSIYVARLSEDALTAVSLAFPMQNLMIAAAVGLGVGINALLSRSLGEKNYENANRAAVNGIFLELIACAVFMILGLTVTRVFYTAQVGSGEITDMGVEYLRIVLLVSVGVFCQVGFERLLQATGKTIFAMITQCIGAVINIILDPILIFGLLGAPKMGIAGAAVATVIGQICAAIAAAVINIKLNTDIHISFKKFRPDGTIIKHILSVGIPSMIMQSIGSVMTFGMNKILNGFSSTAVAVFGVYFKLQSFVFMPVFGLNNGMVPIIAYNYGAGHRERIKKTIKLSVVYAMSIMIVGLIVFQTVPGALIGLFNKEAALIHIGTPALRRISISFIFAGFCVVSSSVYQAMGKGVYSLWVSVARQLLFLLPLAFVFSLTGNLDLVWFAFPLAELVSVTLCVVFIKRLFRKVKI